MIIGSLASGFLEQPEERIVNLEKLVKLVDAEQQTAIEFRYIKMVLVLLYAVASLQWPLLLCPLIILTAPGLGIYKRKKENKKTRMRPRKKELAQENRHSTKKAPTKKRTRSRKHALVHEKKKFLNKEKYQSILLSTTLHDLSIRLIKTT